MGKGRFEAFSDGVLAIIITIMVLELKVPPEGKPDRASLSALWEVGPKFLSYVLSFIYVGIYWNNHHHLIKAADGVNGAVMWANLHLLFWLSLIPFGTAWMGENHFAPVPTALYGGVLLMSALAYSILVKAILCQCGTNSVLAAAVGRDWKGKFSLLLYFIAIPLACFLPWLAGILYAVGALTWLIPDRRMVKALKEQGEPGE